MLVLGIGVFGATPAYAAACPSPIPDKYVNSAGCTNTAGTTKYYLNGTEYDTKDAWNTANKAACSPTGGARTGINCSQGNDQPDTLFGNGSIVNTVINVMLFIIGILCVIMIIFGGIRYTTSTGDKTRVDNAKNTIIYAVVGLIIAIVAYALVNWVFGSLTGSN
jgi:hypothetical protein